MRSAVSESLVVTGPTVTRLCYNAHKTVFKNLPLSASAILTDPGFTKILEIAIVS